MPPGTILMCLFSPECCASTAVKNVYLYTACFDQICVVDTYYICMDTWMQMLLYFILLCVY